jgi:FAD/FMN-containing dehydrogenase
MTWITDSVERQRQETERATTIASYVLENREKLQHQIVPTWERIFDAIDRDVRELNAHGKQLVVERGPTMIPVRADNEITAQFVLEMDFTQGRLHPTCPVPPGKIGVGQCKYEVRVRTKLSLPPALSTGFSGHGCRS